MSLRDYDKLTPAERKQRRISLGASRDPANAQASQDEYYDERARAGHSNHEPDPEHCIVCRQIATRKRPDAPPCTKGEDAGACQEAAASEEKHSQKLMTQPARAKGTP